MCFFLQAKPLTSSYSLQCMLHCRYSVERGMRSGRDERQRAGERERKCSVWACVGPTRESVMGRGSEGRAKWEGKGGER